MLRRQPLSLVLSLGLVLIIAACGRSESPSSGASSSTATKPVFGFLASPAENQQVAPGTFVSGWALSDAGIAEVSVTFDDGQKGYVQTGIDFPGVKEQYPNAPDKDKAGYIFAIPKMTPGPHSLTVSVRGRDGGSMEIQRRFSVG